MKFLMSSQFALIFRDPDTCTVSEIICLPVVYLEAAVIEAEEKSQMEERLESQVLSFV
tara:strand:+ start:546 stop:719 length:174 start_codon:yes stop_codon:yes gene_type:complete